MLLTRNQVVEEYKKLAIAAGLHDNAAIRLVEELPPSFCRALALEVEPTISDIQKAAFSGVNDDSIKFLCSGDKRIGIYVSDINPPVMSALPMSGHKSSPDAVFYIPYIEASLNLLGNINAGLLDFVWQWTSLIIWTERHSNYAGTLLTSSTFPNFPHCTFLSHKALQHIPPNNVLGYSSDYALAENLYHEALHQELAALLLHKGVLKASYNSATAERIHVPWRGGSWEPDRVFHATYVYSHLIHLRDQALHKLSLRTAEREWLERSIEHGTSAYRYLLDQLKMNLHVFEDGCAENILGLINSVHTSRFQ